MVLLGLVYRIEKITLGLNFRMVPIHTHYDNLKVARNAPPEIIRAAYKKLCQKFHPDRNLGSSDSERIMVIINTSYEVLSNPIKRLDHDDWIAEQEQQAEQSTKANSQAKLAPQPPLIPIPIRTPIPTPTPTPAAAGQRTQKAATGAVMSHFVRNWFLYGVASFLLVWASV